MKRYFVPYSGEKPASVLINGHRMVILSPDRETMEEGLALIGADNVKAIKGGESEDEERSALQQFAAKAHAGVVIAPSSVGVQDILRNLEAELPWLQ